MSDLRRSIPFLARETSLPSALVSLLIVVLGCRSTTGPSDDSPHLLQTEEVRYQLRPDWVGLAVDIPYVFENRTGAPVYLVNCNGAFPLRLERLEGAGWIPAWGPGINHCLSHPIIIDAGAVFPDTLRVWGALPGGDVGPQFDVSDPTGTYRIVWMAALSSFQNHLPFGPEIPLAHRISNSFLLTLASVDPKP